MFKLSCRFPATVRCMATQPQIYANRRNPLQSTGLPVERSATSRGQIQLRIIQYSRQELASFCNFTPALPELLLS